MLTTNRDPRRAELAAQIVYARATFSSLAATLMDGTIHGADQPSVGELERVLAAWGTLADHLRSRHRAHLKAKSAAFSAACAPG